MKGLEGGILDGLAGSRQKLHVVGQVVEGCEASAQRLSAPDQMAEIGATMAGAGGTRTIRIERPVLAREAGVAQVQDALGGEQDAVSTVACRDHAIEEVHARRDAVEEIERPTEAHQVARSILRKRLVGDADRGAALRPGLAEAEAAVGIALELELGRGFRA